jgi:hypothetical protein
MGTRHNDDHTLECFCFFGVDGLDLGMGMGAAQERGVAHVWQDDVVNIAAFTRQNTGVFDPLHALADPVQAFAWNFALP